MSTVLTAHIQLDENRVAWIDDTNIKAIEIAIDRIAHGWSPEEIYFQHYGYLSLAQIYAALSYYYDHQSEFDAQIEQDVQEVRELRAKTQDTPLHQRLRSMGLLK